jgi:hypothetical protein
MLTQPKYIMKLGQIDGERVVLYTAGTGSHCYAIACEVAEGEDAGQTVKHTLTLINKDGVISQKTIETIKDVFGCKQFDPFWFPEAASRGELDDIRFELTGKIETSEKGTQYWKGEWLNAIGGSASMPKANVNKQELLARFGSQFRALSGGAPAPAQRKSTPPPAAKKSTPPPPPTGPAATMEEAWQALLENNPGISDEDAAKLWSDTIANKFPGKTNTDLTPQDWGKLKEVFSDRIPM